MEMQATATVKVTGYTGTFVVRREDGHQLSLSKGNGLIEWKGNRLIQDHGVVLDATRLIHILTEFIGQDNTALLPN